MYTNQIARGHIAHILQAMNALNRVWGESNDEYNAILQRLYPFQKSFDEVCTDVEVWLESIPENTLTEEAERVVIEGFDYGDETLFGIYNESGVCLERDFVTVQGAEDYATDMGWEVVDTFNI